MIGDVGKLPQREKKPANQEDPGGRGVGTLLSNFKRGGKKEQVLTWEDLKTPALEEAYVGGGKGISWRKAFFRGGYQGARQRSCATKAPGKKRRDDGG